ncbi:helix-turn-helix transcriptional regulator [Streptomyces bungoensis]|uniref:helix-turn-helix transcriptional regulator n=1 Tax=Streptomyces bungoensis TaxID=285568 RepID=UPI00341CA07A
MSTRESPRRQEVLEVLRAAPEPLGVAETAERLGVHPNTVRFHLDALVADGLVERSLAAPSGPGRPRTVYTAHRGMDRGGVRGYQLLARMLLGRWASADPAEARAEAEEAGRAWGRYLVDPLPPSVPPTAERSAERLVALLDDLGFAPAPEGADPAGGPPDRIRLRHCPFLELAEEHSELVCPLHLGLMRGALDGLGAPLTATGLEPFAEPDSCLAHLAAPPAGRPPTAAPPRGTERRTR